MSSETEKSSGDHERLAYATFSIIGDEIAPDFWTQYFGVVPTIEVVKGNLFKTPSGSMSSTPGRTGVWAYSSKNIVHDDILDPHIRFLVNCLKLPRTDLPNLLVEKKAKSRLSCFWSNYRGDRVPTIDDALRQIVELSGGVIEIDEYPQRHKLITADGKEVDLWV
jgi:hypothetical protein